MACVYVCMHVCVYACMHVCVYAKMHVCVYGMHMPCIVVVACTARNCSLVVACAFHVAFEGTDSCGERFVCCRDGIRRNGATGCIMDLGVQSFVWRIAKLQVLPKHLNAISWYKWTWPGIG